MFHLQTYLVNVTALFDQGSSTSHTGTHHNLCLAQLRHLSLPQCRLILLNLLTCNVIWIQPKQHVKLYDRLPKQCILVSDLVVESKPFLHNQSLVTTVYSQLQLRYQSWTRKFLLFYLFIIHP